jgi:hypothetical protein
MKLSLDLHVHSNHSYDGRDSVKDILESAKKAGLDGVAITDHDVIDGAIEAEKIAEGMIVIPGIEVSTADGHIIVLGVKEVIPAKLSLDETIEIARKKNGVIVAAHPFHILRHPIGDFSKLDIDAVEVYNSRYILGLANKKAARIASKNGFPQVAGSDAHTAEFVGYGVTVVEADSRDAQSILKSISEGRTYVKGTGTPLGFYLNQVRKGVWIKIKNETRQKRNKGSRHR